MITLHMVCSLLSYAAFLVAFITGILFLIQERQLKRKTIGFLCHRLPSLGALDRLNFMAISAGFALLSLGLLAGFLGLKAFIGQWWVADPKVHLAVVLWVAYLALWLMRLRSTLRGRRVAVLSILGFTLVLFTMLEVSHLMRAAHLPL